MSAIDTILETIKNAVYGRDIRQAIHDGIKQCYEDATGDPLSGNTATAGQAPIADGQGGWAWGDVQGGGSVPTEVRQAISTLLLTATYKETGLTDEKAIIQSWASEVTAISVTPSTASISGARTQQLTAVATPAGASVSWTSSNTSVATVSSGGLVTGVGNGTCTITATSGGVSATCTVTVSGFATLLSIDAVYTQSGTVYDTDTLDSLKADLVVTGTYDDNTTRPITDYVLSGTLAEGVSVITVSYGGKTTAFNVAVSAPKSDMNHWFDGIAYTDLDIVENEYVRSGNGEFLPYNGWSRTGFVYCEGASSITFPPIAESGNNPVTSNAFYSEKSTDTRLSNMTLSRTESTTVAVPSTAKYFAISSDTTALNDCISTGIVPHA